MLKGVILSLLKHCMCGGWLDENFYFGYLMVDFSGGREDGWPASLGHQLPLPAGAEQHLPIRVSRKTHFFLFCLLLITSGAYR